MAGLALILAALAAFLVIRRRKSRQTGPEGRERLPTHSTGPVNGRSTSTRSILDSYQRSDDASSAPPSASTGQNSGQCWVCMLELLAGQLLLAPHAFLMACHTLAVGIYTPHMHMSRPQPVVLLPAG